jgi:hypothetical protein
MAMRVFVPFPDDFDELERELARLPLVPYRPGVALACADAPREKADEPLLPPTARAA